MTGRWFEERKETLLRELLVGFVESWTAFEGLYQAHQRHNRPQFERWESWIGNESRKGSLWRLTELSHSIFRRAGARPTMHEVLFDWSLAGIFHECLKVREEAFQLSNPLALARSEHSLSAPEIRNAIEEWERRMAQIRVSMRSGYGEIQRLFRTAWTGLKGALVVHREMGFVMRALAEQRERIVELVGDRDWSGFAALLHPHGEADVWYLAGLSYRKSGWIQRGANAFGRALALCPEHPAASKMREAISEAGAD